jgi:hypothetical protein
MGLEARAGWPMLLEWAGPKAQLPFSFSFQFNLNKFKLKFQTLENYSNSNKFDKIINSIPYFEFKLNL